MVAPPDTGDLVRSLVRVPGSGSNRAAGAECLDLGRASTLAASVAVPTTLPPALAMPKVAKPVVLTKNNQLGTQVGAEAGILASKSINTEDRKRQRPEETSGNSSDSSSSKKPRLYTIGPSKRVVSVSNIGPVVLMAMEPQTSTQSLVSINRVASLSQLIQERDNLRQENQDLQNKLAQIRQLFRDRKRLTSVINLLKEKETGGKVSSFEY